MLELKPESALGWFGIGLAHEALNTPSQAIGDYQRAIQFGIRQPAAHNNLGVLLAARGDLPGAIAQYNAAIALNAQFADACYNRGVAKFANGDSAGALADYKQAISVDPNHAPAINNLGAMFRDAGNTEHALLLLQKAVDVNPEFLLARRNLAATLRLAGRTAEADALATDVSNPQYDLAMQLEKAGDRAASLKSLRDAIKSVPNDVRARNALAWRLLQQPAPTPDERRESLTHALRAAELTEQKNARVLLTLALAHAAAEDYAQARSVANSALALNPPKDVQAPIRNLLSQLPTK
ncbi:MAG: tetratricopeptide (TPR) repeat protein [Rhodothermales bacterium]